MPHDADIYHHVSHCSVQRHVQHCILQSALPAMWSAEMMVERRWAMMSVVRPAMRPSRAAWTSLSDSLSSALVASSRSSTCIYEVRIAMVPKMLSYPTQAVLPKHIVASCCAAIKHAHAHLFTGTKPQGQNHNASHADKQEVMLMLHSILMWLSLEYTLTQIASTHPAACCDTLHTGTK